MENKNIGTGGKKIWSTMDKKSGGNRVTFSRIIYYLVVAVIVFYIFIAIYGSLLPANKIWVNMFNTIFISILIQAFPFVLIGILISSAMHVFVPNEHIIRIFPQKNGLGFVTALFAGLLFPVCECAVVPVMTRLVKKGVSLPIAVTFLLAAPIINPIVIVSTLYAFPGQPEVTVLRIVLGLGIALLVGIILSFTERGKALPLRADIVEPACSCGCGTEKHNHSEKDSMAKRIRTMLVHAGNEFFDVVKYLIIGAFFTALVQMIFSAEAFAALGGQTAFSLMVMMGAAFLFSACSTSDAFIARSFTGKLPLGAVMGFIVYGPMMDIKNLLMLTNGFRKSFVAKLALIITVLNFAVLYIIARFVL